GVADMNMRTRILVAVLGSLACLSYVQTTTASDQTTSDDQSSDRHRPPGEVIPSDIYDPLGLVAHGDRGQLVTSAKGFSFTEGPAADRRGNVFFTDQPNDRIWRWDA